MRNAMRTCDGRRGPKARLSAVRVEQMQRGGDPSIHTGMLVEIIEVLRCSARSAFVCA